jgi:hypothetical protein
MDETDEVQHKIQEEDKKPKEESIKINVDPNPINSKIQIKEIQNEQITSAAKQ